MRRQIMNLRGVSAARVTCEETAEHRNVRRSHQDMMPFSNFHLLMLILLLMAVPPSIQSECIVSSWSDWSDCYGGCLAGQVVRNRDVVRPPLPEFLPGRSALQRLCPHLYETKSCSHENCLKVKSVSCRKGLFHGLQIKRRPFATSSEERLGRAFSRPSYEGRRLGFDAEFPRGTKELQLKERIVNNKTNGEKKFKTSREFRNFAPSEYTIDISSEQISNADWRGQTRHSTPPTLPFRGELSSDDLSSEVGTAIQREQSERTRTTAQPLALASIYPEESASFVRHRHSGRQRKYSRSRYQGQSLEMPINAVLRRIENALDLNLPLDEKFVRTASKKNGKLTKILFDAYLNSQAANQTSTPALSTSAGRSSPTTTVVSPTSVATTQSMITTISSATTTTTADTTPSATSTTTTPSIQPTVATVSTDPPPFVTAIVQTSTTSLPTTTTTTMQPSTTTTIQTPLFWPKIGYIPNSRKHASDITSKLYMTREIVQALADDPLVKGLAPECKENRRCCKVQRSECADGRPPIYVKRYYRPRGALQCLAYHYPKCSAMEEMEELPILFEQNCQDVCFGGPEKRIAPLFELSFEEE